jgi:tRNA (cmo5U34)-methyltransferase
MSGGRERAAERLEPMRDQLFREAKPAHDFTFDANVAGVFDDMLERSIPFYNEVQRMVVEVSLQFLGDEGVCYDIGCSTGNTLAALARSIDPTRPIRFIGLEPSEAMREHASRKFADLPAPERLTIIPDLAESVERLDDARVITMLYTLQFIRPLHRLKVLKMCHRSLQCGGCLIVAEKILAESALRRLFIDFYHDYKRRSGYTDMEISSKREALENVLVPFTGAENISMLKEAGFTVVESIFQWYNFAVYLAVKS